MPLFLVLRVIIYLEQCTQCVWFFEISCAGAGSQLRSCTLISRGLKEEPSQEIVMQKLPLPCITWAADGTFVTVELSHVKNTGDKCVLARKTCSKLKAAAYQILSAHVLLQLKGSSCDTQFSSLQFLATSAVLCCPVRGKMFSSFPWPALHITQL